MPKHYCNSFYYQGWHFCLHAQLPLARLDLLDIISSKNSIWVYLKWHLFLFSFIFFVTGISVLQVSVFCHGFCCQYHNLKLICHLQYQIHNGRSLKTSLIFCWNMSPAGTTPNGSLVNLYLPN